jgi:hypothetical protein
LYAFEQAIKGIYATLVNPNLFTSTYNQSLANLNNLFNNSLTIQNAQTTISVNFPSNTTLERFAETQLGDANRWIEIATLNNLQEPYVSSSIQEAQSNPNTTYPGATILLPASLTTGFSPLPQVPLLPQFNDLPFINKTLGIDLKLTSNYDLDFTNSNDINLISGLDNLQQAVLLKLFYEKGDLLQHPEIGIGLDVGDKVPSLTQVQSAIINSVLADPRVQTLTNLNISQLNDALSITFNVIPKNFNVPLPIELVV